MPPGALRLLALDGGGVRGLSSLMILRRLMETIDPHAPPKPCDYFDMIGGTSTGGLIAIMLGRLRMTVDECIDAYITLSDRVFEKKAHRVTVRGKLKGRFDSNELERAVRTILVNRGLDEDALLKDLDSSCKVFVCATSKETGDTVCLANYRSPRSDNSDLLNATTIWQACRATSAATTFFDPIAIGPFGEQFVDGALGANNPVYAVWNQAQDLWGVDQLRDHLQCLVSIGTGLPTLKPVRDDAFGIWATLKDLTTETEKTAQQFHRDKAYLDDEGRYYRFNVDRGLEEIGLQESKKKTEIAAATRRYVESQTIFRQMKACANNLTRRVYHGPYRTTFTLQGVPVSKNFVARPSVTAELEKCLLPQPCSRETRRRIFVLYGLGGIGKTQLAADFARRHKDVFSSIFWIDGRSEDRLKQSFASCAARIPEGQISERSRKARLQSKEDRKTVVAEVLDWLARPGNSNWLLIFDNVDQDVNESSTGAYDIRQYLPGDHGSVLITTRLSRLAQLGESLQLRAVDDQLAQAIFQKWFGSEGALDEAGRELLDLLHGLPLALAQAASFLRETGIGTASYVRLYKQQWDDLMRSNGQSGFPLVDYEQGSVATTWTVSFKAIEAQNKNAANLLRLWAFVDGRDLWHGLLQAAIDIDKEWPQWLCDIASNEVRYLDAVELLLRYSMIESHESVQGGHMMHPVVHRWASHIQDSAAKKEFLRLAVMAIGILVPDEDSRDYWVVHQRLLPHVERCSWWIGEISKKGWSFDDTTSLGAIHNLGKLLYHQGRLTEAESMYQRALEGKEKALGRNHLLTLDTVSNLGVLYEAQGRLTEAEPMYQRALEGCEKVLGRNHPSTLNTVNNLGVLYDAQGRLTEAESMYQLALEGYEKVLGRDHALTLETVYNLGCLYRDQHRLMEAESMYQRALSGLQSALGSSHPKTQLARRTLDELLQIKNQSALEPQAPTPTESLVPSLPQPSPQSLPGSPLLLATSEPPPKGHRVRILDKLRIGLRRSPKDKQQSLSSS
ncbi:hypothetical protein VTJ04DRAFT_10169 [Mycothermus thermophilus]|uniref:uncharacterized protein n=1 Tax=Humicola insolens TaxID=85995 RepID=UPI003743AAD9